VGSTICFDIDALTDMTELVSKMYFFLHSCCMSGDTFKITGCVILIDLVMLFAQVGKSSRLEDAPPTYIGIDHYVVHC